MRQRLIETEEASEEYTADLWERCDGRIENLTAKMVAEAAGEGNEIAREVLTRACQALGWGIAQVITLVSPEVVVVGGGVSLVDESLFLAPVRRARSSGTSFRRWSTSTRFGQPSWAKSWSFTERLAAASDAQATGKLRT